MVGDFAAAVRQLREERGLSQLALAGRVGLSKPYVGHIETGIRIPHDDYVAKIDAVLCAGGRLIALAASARDQRQGLDEVNRRDMLKAVAFGTAELANGGRSRAGQSDVDDLVARTARLRKLDDVLGGADTYPLYMREMRATRAVITGMSYSELTGLALLETLSEQAQLAGWAAFDAGWDKEAADLFGRSKVWAEAAGSPALAANALALLAYQCAFAGAPDRVLAGASCKALTPGTPPAVRALIYERAAWTYAVAGDRGGTDRALDQAYGALTAPVDGRAPAWTSWIDQDELMIMTGRCRAALNGSSEAVTPLTDALSRFPDEYARDKALYLLALARAHARAGDLEESASVAARAARLSAGVRSARPAKHLATVARMLSPHQAVPAVSEALDRIGHATG